MPDLLTPAELAAIADREAKATPWPWKVVGDNSRPFLACDKEHNSGYLGEGCLFSMSKYGKAWGQSYVNYDDLEFIAHARADIPALLRHIAALEARTPAPADDPEMDGTDFAHPAWWRGHDHTTAMFCHAVNEILDGKDDGVGVNAEGPWCDTRKRLLALMGKPAPALPADMEVLLAEAENVVANERRWLEAQKPERDLTSRLATALRETLAREQAERARAEKATEQWLDADAEAGRFLVRAEKAEADLAAARKELAGLKGGAA